MQASDLRKTMLLGKKSDRVIFAVTPELKHALSVLAESRCTSVSALITGLIMDEVESNAELFTLFWHLTKGIGSRL